MQASDTVPRVLPRGVSLPRPSALAAQFPTITLRRWGAGGGGRFDGITEEVTFAWAKLGLPFQLLAPSSSFSALFLLHTSTLFTLVDEASEDLPYFLVPSFLLAPSDT